ncbi:MAG TPA: chemotaxis protein CheW [Bryobacteraceae bacterium]|nr:chemotaxis protein CheW [Bryobacteraceae bacterium]
MQTATAQDVSGARIPVMDYRAGKYLAFYVGPEEFAIGVLGVREIMGMQDVTAVPHTPAYVKGIINLRGKVVPVVDLRLKFGMPPTEYTARTCIVVVNVAGDGEGVLMGVIVDAVSEVVNIATGEIEGPPDFGESVSIPYLIGIAKSKGKVKLLLNIEKVLTTSELTDLGQLLS